MLNAAGKVIGVYSRPTPRRPTDDPDAPVTHEATSLRALSEIEERAR